MILFENFILQIIFSIGLVIIVAAVIGLVSKLFYLLLGRTAHNVIVCTGFIGTPIHEIGHAIMCLIFGHKIEQIVLFQPSAPRGVLGYVEHSYNRKNIYHQIGTFFISVGPIILGAVIMIGLLFGLLPEVARGIFGLANEMSAGFNAVGGNAGAIFKGLGQIFVLLFSPKNLASWQWWIYILLCMLIAMHMKLSVADIKGMVVGLILVVGIVFVIDLVVWAISAPSIVSMTSGIIVMGSYIIAILSISLILSLVQLGLAMIYATIVAIVKKISYHNRYN